MFVDFITNFILVKKCNVTASNPRMSTSGSKVLNMIQMTFS